MDPPQVLTDLHSTAATMKGPGDEHNQDAYGEQRRGAVAMGRMPGSKWRGVFGADGDGESLREDGVFAERTK